jgi:uncharacterized protein
MTVKSQESKIPSPIRDTQSNEFFEGTSKGKLMIKQCPSCNVYAAPVVKYCGSCLLELQWTEASRTGKVFNWTVIPQAVHPSFVNEVPYVIGTIELEENVRILSNIYGIHPKDLKIGLDVIAEFKQWPNGEFLPIFIRLTK